MRSMRCEMELVFSRSPEHGTSIQIIQEYYGKRFTSVVVAQGWGIESKRLKLQHRKGRKLSRRTAAASCSRKAEQRMFAITWRDHTAVYLAAHPGPVHQTTFESRIGRLILEPVTLRGDGYEVLFPVEAPNAENPAIL